MPSGDPLQVYGPINERLAIGSFSPDDSRVAISSLDGSVRVWDVETAREILTIEIPPPGGPVGVAFDPVTGDRLAVAVEGPGELGAGVVVFDSHTGEELLRAPFDDGVCELRWSPDGNWIATASADSVGRVLDATTGDEISIFPDHHSFLCTVDFSPDGTQVVTGGDDGTARIWEAKTGRQTVLLAGHEERVGFASFSPDGRRVVTSSDDDQIRIWDVSPEGRREVLSVFDPTVAIRARYSPDGSQFATASNTGVAGVWEAATGAPVLPLEGHESWVYSIAYSHDGARLVTAGRDFTARLWDAATGDELASLELPAPALSVTFSPDDQEIAIGTMATAHLWNPSTGDEVSLASFEDGFGFFFGTAFSPEGTLLAAGDDFAIQIWDTATGERLEPIVVSEEFFHGVQHLQFTANGERLLSANRDGLIRLYDVESGELIRIFEGHAGLVWDAQFNPDETLIVSASFDGTVRLWDAATGEEILLLEDDQAFTSASFSPDGEQILVSGDFGARVHLVNADDLITLAEIKTAALVESGRMFPVSRIKRVPASATWPGFLNVQIMVLVGGCFLSKRLWD